jgi:hypothetical protein
MTERELGKIGQGAMLQPCARADARTYKLEPRMELRNRESVEAMQRAGFHGMGLDR